VGDAVEDRGVDAVGEGVVDGREDPDVAGDAGVVADVVVELLAEGVPALELVP
jgi:hypothetical protein